MDKGAWHPPDRGHHRTTKFNSALGEQRRYLVWRHTQHTDEEVEQRNESKSGFAQKGKRTRTKATCGRKSRLTD
jgi:hypothetical protein